jgi:hypothetical protein
VEGFCCGVLFGEVVTDIGLRRDRLEGHVHIADQI